MGVDGNREAGSLPRPLVWKQSLHNSNSRRGWTFRPLIACKLLKEFGRGEWIRTTDLLVPNQAST